MNRPDSKKLNMMVVILTNDRDATTALCSWNGGQRVRPIAEGFYSGTNRTKPDSIFLVRVSNFSHRGREVPLSGPIRGLSLCESRHDDSAPWATRGDAKLLAPLASKTFSSYTERRRADEYR